MSRKWDKFLKRLEKWLRKLARKAPPAPVTGVHVVMEDKTIHWVLPTARDDGKNLPEAQIDNVEVSLAIAGAPSSVVNNVPPPSKPNGALELLVPNLDPGDWIFTLVVVDTDGRRSTAHEEAVNVLANPGPVTNVTVT